MPMNVASAAPSTVVSNVTGMKCGQLWYGRPPMFNGYAVVCDQYWSA
jgi:hypothetical protein